MVVGFSSIYLEKMLFVYIVKYFNLIINYLLYVILLYIYGVGYSVMRNKLIKRKNILKYFIGWFFCIILSKVFNDCFVVFTNG